MSEAEQERRRWLILGDHDSGSAAQRAALKSWLLEKMQPIGDHGESGLDDLVEGWLAELPWTEEAQG